MIEINVISGKVNDKTTLYTADADKTFTLPISTGSSIGVQIIYAALDAVDSIVKIGGSNDAGANIDYYSETKTLSGTTGSESWEKNNFNFSSIVFDYSKVSNTSGTIQILLTIKQDN